jgi:hypothetical protein
MGLTNKLHVYKYKSKPNFTKKHKQTIKTGGIGHIREINYTEKYKNTPYFPKSNIINEMKQNFSNFLEKSTSDKFNISLNDLFILNIKIKNNKKISINKTLNQNTNMKLNELIENMYYIMSNNFFISKDKIINNDKIIISRIKEQIGKDIVRSTVYINGTIDNKQDYIKNEDDTKEFIEIADLYYEKIIKTFQNFNLPVNYDIINKICLLTTQNLSNFLTDIINLYINSLIKPEMALVYNVNEITKSIEISETKIYFILTQKSKLLVTNDEEWQPDNICGNLYFKFKVDILNDKYIMQNLQLNINTTTMPCSTPTEIMDIPDDNNNNTSNDKKYLIPLLVSVAGVTTSPFLLGAL